MSSKSNTAKMFEDPNKYAFILYSYKDNEIASSNLEIFNQLGVNIDPKECHHEPIHSFSSFERKIRNSSIFIPFLTPNAIDCRNFNRGVCLAATFGVPILPIYLKETNFDDDEIYSLIKEPSIMQYELSDDEYRDACNEEIENIALDIQEGNKVKPFQLIKNLFSFHPKIMQRSSSDNIFLGGVESTGIESGQKSADSPTAAGKKDYSDYNATINVEGTSGIFTRTRERIKNSLYGTRQPSAAAKISRVPNDNPSKQPNQAKEIFKIPNDYIFKEVYLCFSHEDIDLIIDDFGLFLNQESNFNFYDGIECNPKLLDDAESVIKNSTLFIFYVSKKSIASKRTNRELALASLFNIPIYLVYLEEIGQMPSSIEMITKGKLEIPKYNMTQDEYLEIWLKMYIEYSLLAPIKDK